MVADEKGSERGRRKRKERWGKGGRRAITEERGKPQSVGRERKEEIE